MCAGQCPNLRLQLNILVRCGTTWQAAMWRTRFMIPSGPAAFNGGVEAMAWSTFFSVISGRDIWSRYSASSTSRRSGAGGVGKKLALKSRAFSSGSWHPLFVTGSFSIGVVVAAVSPLLLALYVLFRSTLCSCLLDVLIAHHLRLPWYCWLGRSVDFDFVVRCSQGLILIPEELQNDDKSC